MADMFKLQVVTPDKFFYTDDHRGRDRCVCPAYPDDFHRSARCTQHP